MQLELEGSRLRTLPGYLYLEGCTRVRLPYPGSTTKNGRYQKIGFSVLREGRVHGTAVLPGYCSMNSTRVTARRALRAQLRSCMQLSRVGNGNDDALDGRPLTLN